VKDMALVAKASSKKVQDRPKCSHYKISGHIKSKCWQKNPEKKPKKAKLNENSRNISELGDNKGVSLVISAETALFNQDEESISN
jgi:ribosomal protein L32